MNSFIPSVISLSNIFKYFIFFKFIFNNFFIWLLDKFNFSKVSKFVFDSMKSIPSILLKLISKSTKLLNLPFDKLATSEISL